MSEAVEITSIAAGGAGVGRLADGRAVFVHRTAPGDVAEVEVTHARRSWARARLVRLRHASPDRRGPACPHYDRCGGCTLEHLRYPAQLEAKSRIVADALARIGGVEVVPPEVVPSPLEFGYRNRVSFTLVRLAGGRVVAGFHEIERPGRVFDVDGRCLLPEQPIARVWDTLRGVWGPGARRLPPGRELRLTLRASAAEDVVLLIEGGRVGGDAGLLADTPGLGAVWHAPARRPGGADAPRAAALALVAGASGLVEAWGDEEIRLGGGAFLQVNRSAAAGLEAHVVALAGDVAGSHVVDAYCGVGLYARRFARAGARVTGIELDVQAADEARVALGGLDARIREGRVEDELPAALPAELVVLNPPRTGLDRRVPRALGETAPGRVIYVSCDPATLARDLARMAPGFEVRSVRCFDLFPQTSHVETVVELACAIT